ncbi:MAG: glycosyltransferase family 39 protein [Chloroflexi bacterium]|nr:glycosyltransferase family 39 protein [Chloroflexota bacterium]
MREHPPLRRGYLFILIGIAILAAMLRFYRLGAQSFWNDEGTSVALALRDLATITRNAAHDIHPPFYYYLLHGWIRLFGAGEIGARSLSAIVGVALAGALYILGRRLFDPRVGRLASLLAATSPFMVYYSQEARMYILAAFLGTISWLGFDGWLTAWGRSSGRLWAWTLLYIVSSVASIYTHYLGFFILIAQNLAFLLWMAKGWPRHRRKVGLYPLWSWIGLQALIGVSYLPWLSYAQRSLQAWPAVSQPLSLLDLAKQTARILPLGVTVAERTRELLIGLALSCFVLPGLLCSFLERKARQYPSHPLATWQMALYLFVPILLLYFFSWHRPMYKPKFLLLAAPAFCLAQARGIAALSAWLERISRCTWTGALGPILGTAMIWAGSAHSFHALYTDPAYARDDYRGIVAYIQASSRPGDAILINAPSQIETVDLYYEGPLPMYPLPRQRPPDRARLEGELQEIAAQHERLYGIFWATAESDPQGWVEGWLDDHAFKTMDSWFGHVRLVIYALPAEAPQEIARPTDYMLGDRIRLLGYTLGAGGQGGAVESGDILPLTLFWQAIEPVGARYKVFTHLVNRRDLIVAQRDSEPGGGGAMTDRWPVGERIVDHYGLLIQPGTPPGEYTLWVGMYGLDDGKRLPVSLEGSVRGDAIDLARVRVLPAAAPPPLAALDMQKRLDMRWDGLELLGFSLHRLGQEHIALETVRPGDILRLTLFWRRGEGNGAPAEFVVSLRDRSYRLVWERALAPAEGDYPFATWRSGEIVRDLHALHLPPELTPGDYVLNLAPAGRPEEGLTLRRIEVRR